MKKILAILVGLSLLICSQFLIAFDKKAGTFPEFSNVTPGSTPTVSEGWLNITTIGHAEGLYPDFDTASNSLYYRRGVGIFYQNGSGYHIGGGWIITNAHVIKPPKVAIPLNSAFSFIVPVDKIIDIDFFIGMDSFGAAHGTLIWVNEEYDLAMLWVDPATAPFLKDYGYRTTWTWTPAGSLIETGDVIATIVRVRDKDGSKLWYSELRFGKIIAPKPVLPPEISTDFLPWFSLNDFTTDLRAYPGDSGSPVFVFQNGVPVIIGLLRATITTKSGTYTYITRTDYIHRKTLERR